MEEVIGSSNSMTIIDQQVLCEMENLISDLCLLRIKLVQILSAMGTLMICGVAVQSISALEIISMDAPDLPMATIISTLLWVPRLPLSTLLVLDMEEFKSKLNYLKVIGFGLLFGYCLNTINMVNGLQVVKLILWRAEAMLIILNLLEEVLKVWLQLCIGVPTTRKTFSLKLMQNILWIQVHSMMISTHSVFIGTKTSFTHMWIMIQTKFFR